MSGSFQHTNANLDFGLPYRVSRNVNDRREDLGTLKLDYDVNQNVGLYLKGYYHSWHTSYDTYYNSVVTPGATDVLYQDAFWGYDDRGINALARFSFTQGIEYYLREPGPAENMARQLHLRVLATSCHLRSIWLAVARPAGWSLARQQ